MITNHQYLLKYPIDRSAKKLILGTIHPHNHKNFLIDFFYGNELSIWKILNKAFPNDLQSPYDLDSILNFLKLKRIAVSDTIISCERVNPTALDKDLIPIDLNIEALKNDIANSSITEILCTSGFGKNNAFKLFYCDILGLKLNKTIRNERQVLLPSLIFGRPVKVKFIYSPSRNAIRGISRSKAYKDIRHNTSVEQFRINLYKDAVNE